MIAPKNRIHLSRRLISHTTPYPEANRWLRVSVFFTILVLILGMYFYTRPESRNNELLGSEKQILGETTETKHDLYVVKPGDTLFSISQSIEVKWETIAELNGLEEPYILRTGDNLKIPKQIN